MSLRAFFLQQVLKNLWKKATFFILHLKALILFVSLATSLCCLLIRYGPKSCNVKLLNCMKIL